MATCTATGGRLLLLRAALLVTTGLVLSIGSPAWARVGVTSGADGDPLGKPPNENERILRIGIDVQANELITTAANDRAHLVFIDGSSLTVGPNARLTIDRFVFDPSTQKGELAINASKGVLRLVGGKISKTNAITISYPLEHDRHPGRHHDLVRHPGRDDRRFRLRQQHDGDRGRPDPDGDAGGIRGDHQGRRRGLARRSSTSRAA